MEKKYSPIHDQGEKKENKNTAKTILIDGAAGFVGSNLCRALLEEGHLVLAVDNLITGKIKNIIPLLAHKNFYFYKMDIVDSRFRRLFSGLKIDEIYHLACPTGVPNIKTLGREMIFTCSIGTINIMEVAKKHRASVVFSSSAEIYGQALVSPQNEAYTGNVDTLGPRSAYEEGKRFSESVIKMYHDRHGIGAKVVRIFNTYGPGMSLEDLRVMPRFIKNILEKKPLEVYGDGSQTRTFLYVDDLIRGLKLVMKKGNPGEAYNIGGSDEISIKNLAKIMSGLAGAKNGLIHSPHFIEDHKSRRPDTTRANMLGWKPAVNLEEGLVRMFRSNGFGHPTPAGPVIREKALMRENNAVQDDQL